jgi:ribosomal protein S27AE
MDHPHHADPQPPAAPMFDYHTIGPAEKTVRLRRFGSDFEANLALSALRAQGIRAQLVGEAVTNTLSIYGTAINGVDLLVMQEDVPVAREILEKIDHRRAERAAASTPHCPRCGSARSRSYDRRRAAAGVVLLLAGAGLFVVQNWFAAILTLLCFGGLVLLITALSRRTCPQCGYAWTPTDTPTDEK